MDFAICRVMYGTSRPGKGGGDGCGRDVNNEARPNCRVRRRKGGESQEDIGEKNEIQIKPLIA